MQGIIRAADGRVAGHRGREETSVLRHDIAGREVEQGGGIAAGTGFEPALVEIMAGDRPADYAERMKVLGLRPMPAQELNAELVGGLGGADESPLIDAEPLYQADEGRNRGLTDPDGSDLFGLDQLDAAQRRFQMMAEHRGGEPPGSTAADDDDL